MVRCTGVGTLLGWVIFGDSCFSQLGNFQMGFYNYCIMFFWLGENGVLTCGNLKSANVGKKIILPLWDIVSLCQPTLSPHSTTHLFTNYPQLPFPSLTLSLPKSTPIPNLNPLSLPYHYLPPIVKANSSYIPGTMPRLMEQNYLHPTWNQPQNWTPPAPLILS